TDIGPAFPSDSYPGHGEVRAELLLYGACIRRDAGGVEGATIDYTKLTLAELRNGISDTKSAINRCKEALDNLRQSNTVGLQAMADAITHLLPRLEQDLKALEKAYIAKTVSRGFGFVAPIKEKS